MMITTLIGLAAATCTTASYVPQLKQCRDTGRAEDLSKKMILTLGFGIALWIVYGFARQDVVIILANGISVLLLLGIFYFKWRPQPDGAQTIKNDIVCLRHLFASRSKRRRRNKAF